MSIVSVERDYERLRLELVAEFDCASFESGEHMERVERLGAFDVFPPSVAQMDAVLATHDPDQEVP